MIFSGSLKLNCVDIFQQFEPQFHNVAIQWGKLGFQIQEFIFAAVMSVMKAWFITYKGWAVCYISEIFDRLPSCGGSSSRSASFSTVCLEVIGKVLEALAAHSLALLSSRLPSLWFFFQPGTNERRRAKEKLPARPNRPVATCQCCPLLDMSFHS